jgi:hypothetical protein
MSEGVVLTTEEIADLCGAGAMAPSGANAQPWQVTVRGDRMRIGLDPRRSAESFLDVGGYGSLFGLGCFAENVGIAAHSRGLEHRVAVHGGTVEFVFSGRRAAAQHELAPYLARRVTNRRLSDGSQLPESEVRHLADIVAGLDTGYRLTAVSAAAGKRKVAYALGLADATRMRHRRLFAEMVAEICWSTEESLARQEGLDLTTLELPASTVRLLSLLRRFPRLRTLLPRARLADTARSLVRGCSHVCCLSTSSPLTPEAIVLAGRAFQRLWLDATRRDISVHPWSVSTFMLIRVEVFGGAGLSGAERNEVAGMGQALRDAFGLAPDETPVFVFRLSKAPPPTARSLRLPWQSFTTVER